MTSKARPRIVSMALWLGLGACGGSGDDPSAAVDEPAADEPAEAEAGKAASAEPEPAPEPPPSGYAVVRVGAQLFDSSTGGVGFELPPLGSEPTAPAGITVNVVGEKDGRLEVETLVEQPTDHHCAGSISGLRDFRLRLYVAKNDLLPVLTQEVSKEFADGTKLQLARGVPVPSGAESPLVAAGTLVETAVPSGSTGLFYEPGEPFSAEATEKPLYDGEDPHPLTYDGGRILEEGMLYHPDGAVDNPGSPIKRFGTTDRGEDSLVTVRNACLEVTALVSRARTSAAPSVSQMARSFDPDMMARNAGILGMMEHESGHFLASPYGAAFAEAEGDDEDVWGGLTGAEVGEAFGVGGLGLVGTGHTVPRYAVKAGTAIVWADGRPAGQVTADHTFVAPPRDEGGRSCFDVSLSHEPTPAVTLCFAPGDVTETRVPGVIGLGSTGLIGKAGEEGFGGGTGSGYGTGSGAGFGGRGKRVPRVRQAKAEVKGTLDKDIIRRIVRAHINEVRYCYNQGLARDPSLKGRVAVQFTIAATGKVPVAVVESTDLKDKNVANCVAKAIKRWKFPKPPGGGAVVVTYPFVLEPG